MTSRVEKYKDYRKSITTYTDKVPVLKPVSKGTKLDVELSLYKKIVAKKRAANILLILAIVAIATLLVVFGFIVFKGK